jgi:hypothetical protein
VGESALLPAHETDSLSTELSRHVVETLAPDEIPFFVDAVKDFHDHRSIEPGSRSRDEPLGFGAEFSLLAPYVITVMPTIINFLAGVLSSIAQEEIATGLGPLPLSSQTFEAWCLFSGSALPAGHNAGAGREGRRNATKPLVGRVVSNHHIFCRSFVVRSFCHARSRAVRCFCWPG